MRIATVVSSAGEIAVFIGEIRVAVYLTVEGGAIAKRVVTGMTFGSTAATVERYISDKKGVPGLVLKSPSPDQPPGMPVRGEQSSEQTERVGEPRIMRIRLPPAAPPPYIAFRKAPAEFDSLTVVARKHIGGFHDPSCGPTSVTIPFFSVDDPTVFVYADFGAGCENGIFPFRWDRTGWTSGQFSPNRRPNDWTYTIGQVRKYRLLQFSLP